jgi:hypothetical protein
LQQNQARLEIVGDVREPKRRIVAQLAVGELCAPVLDVFAQQAPDDRPRHTFDQVLAVDEYTVIVGEVANLGDLPLLRTERDGRGRGLLLLLAWD